MNINPNILNEFIGSIGQNNVLYELSDRLVYECDAETIDAVIPDLVLLPNSTQEISQIIKIAKKNNLKIIPRGAGTGLSGGATAYLGGICLALTKMNKVIEINTDYNMIHVETGITNVDVSKATAKFGLHFPCDPSSQFASTIGGNIAENAGGAHTLKCGTTSHHVNGIVLVNDEGAIIQLGQKFNNPQDLDFLHLVCGSEGTLGIVCEAYLNLTPIPKHVETAAVYFASLESAANTVSTIIANGIIPAALELIDDVTLKAVEDTLQLGLDRNASALLIIELDGNKEIVAKEKEKIIKILSQLNNTTINWANSTKERLNLWKARKASFASLGRIAPQGYVLDGVIPRSKLALAINLIRKIAQKYDLAVANVYHAGDGNLHPCLLFNKSNAGALEKVIQASREILLTCLELGGCLSGEHGIGIEKLFEMNDAFTPDTLKFMEGLKVIFDESNMFNPGKILPNPKLCGESRLDNLAKFKISC